jgi:hypothetical protein
MTDDIALGQFALERATDNSTWIQDSGRVLRGYSWVTVVAAELARRLGGEETLQAPAINDFTGERMRRVFETLAPVLLTGAVRFWGSESFRIVEGADAADYR